MDPIGGEPLRRSSFTYMASRRRAGISCSGQQHPQAIPIGPRRVRTFPDERDHSHSQQADQNRVGTALGRRPSSIVEPTGGLHPLGHSEDRTRRTSRYVACSLLAGSGVVRALTQSGHSHRNSADEPEPHSLHSTQSRLASRSRHDRLRQEWQSGIRIDVLSQAGFRSNTGGAEEAARLLSEFGWSSSTWSTRASQVAKWLHFCDEDMRCALPGTEGDVLAYIGFLSLEGRVSAESLPQYISAISRYHELHHLPSPTRSPLVHALQKAYRRAREDTTITTDIRVGCPATVMRHILRAGFAAQSDDDFECCALSIFDFVFQVRSISAAHICRSHIVFDNNGMQDSIYRRKGKSMRRPLLLRYDQCPSWPPDNPIGSTRLYPPVPQPNPTGRSRPPNPAVRGAL